MELTGALIWVERWSTAANLCGRMVLAGEGENGRRRCLGSIGGGGGVLGVSPKWQ